MAVYGPPNNEELYHWKYIRKYKKNGKWRYVYPNDVLGIKEKISVATGEAQKQHEIENAASERAQEKYVNELHEKSNEQTRRTMQYQKKSNDALAAYSKEKERYANDKSTLNSKILNVKQKQHAKALDDLDYNIWLANKRFDEYYSAKKKAEQLSKKNASGIPKVTIEEGKAAVSKLVSKLKSAVNTVIEDGKKKKKK